MKYTIECACTEPAVQREAAQLLGRVFPEYWQPIAEQGRGFPFEEISFIARSEDGRMCGHVGIVPFRSSNGNGGILHFAGIASVGVDPKFRGHGIAADLCEAAAGWAAENDFDALPLFTGKYGVYEHHGWTNLPMPPLRNVILPPCSAKNCRRLSGSSLSDLDREKIIDFYEQSPSFPGKVLRSRGRSYHSWTRIFRESDFNFLVSENGYALIQGNSILELCILSGDGTDILASAGDQLSIVLPPSHNVWKVLKQSSRGNSLSADDVYHGEGIMMRPIRKHIPRDIFFSCADKF